ncbi:MULTISPECIES: hypothetical protein [unclassified Microcoleus]|uniref:hypothetical protein n=1 Tax=unclassified Microcoleus TaxID=2642155 RepID=UPI002FD2F221
MADVNGNASGEVKELFGAAKVYSTSQNSETSRVPKVTSEVSEVHNNNPYSFIFALTEQERSKVLVAVIKFFSQVQIASGEVITLISTNPDRALWLGIKLIKKSMTATIREVLNFGSGGKKFNRGKAYYEELANYYGDFKEEVF